MDLSELAKIKQARDGIIVSQEYLRTAYDLELYAISKFEKISGEKDLLWKHTLLQSAGWLAVKCGYINQAKQLVEEGMRMSVDGYAAAKMRLLKDKVDASIKEQSLPKKPSPASSILGFLTAADFETNVVYVKEKDSHQQFTLQVSDTDWQRIVQLFLGTTVEIETTVLKDGMLQLADIRWAA